MKQLKNKSLIIRYYGLQLKNIVSHMRSNDEQIIALQLAYISNNGDIIENDEYYKRLLHA